MMMQPEISHYNDAQPAELKAVCDLLAFAVHYGYNFVRYIA